MKHLPKVGRTSRLAAIACALALVAGACSNGSSGKGQSGSGNNGSTNGTAQTEGGGLFPTELVNKAVHDGTPVRGGTVTWGLESDVLSVSPNQNPIQPADVQLAAAVFAPLTRFGDHGTFKGRPVTDNTDHAYNQLADSLTSTNDDLQHWTLKLRAGVKFSNGQPVTAQQVVDSTKWAMATSNCSCAQDAKEIVSVTAEGDLTVQYTLKEPVVTWPAVLTGGGLGWITESSARNAAPDPTNPDYTHLIGAGAFKYESHVGDNYTVVRNDDYFGVDRLNHDAKLPYLDKIVFKPLADSTTRLQAVQSGGVQIMGTADTSNLVGAKRSSNLRVQPAEGSSSTILVLNITKPPFGATPKPGETPQQTAIRSLDDPTALAARQAFAYAINRNEINQKYYQGTRIPSYGFFPQSSPWYDPTGQVPRYDPTKAKELVARVTKAGVKMDVQSICIATPESTGVNQILTAQDKAVGITNTLKQVDQAVLVSTLLSGGGNIQWNSSCFRSGMNPDPDGAMYGGLLSTGSANITKYNRPEIDALLNQGRQTADVTKRKAIYDKIQTQVAKDVVIIPLVFDYWGNVFAKSISGLSVPAPNSLGIIDPAGLYEVK
ncbi:MAG: ABC transporter substrate-binding protein [Actinobacteria bacterium]|nr:ABC transporter substrate-binding protein [Actinomycetota bacterium]